MGAPDFESTHEMSTSAPLRAIASAYGGRFAAFRPLCKVACRREKGLA
jgi:hypothetical protein